MEEDEDEEAGGDDEDIFPEYAAALNDIAMGEVDEEEVEGEGEPADDLGQAIRDAQRECESEKEKIKFDRMLEDHKKLLYPTATEGQKKVGYCIRIVTMEDKEWFI